MSETESRSDPEPLCLFTVGHSNHSLDVFVEFLKKHRIELVADVRSSPYSRYVQHFNREEIRPTLEEAGIAYVFLGKELGGQPAEADFYDDDGRVLYYKLAESPVFRAGIERLETEMRERRVAIFCSEEDPAACHRRLLIGRVIAGRGYRVVHIRGDGSVQVDAAAQEASPRQQLLFDLPEDNPWKSLRSVSPRRRPSSSSDSSGETESGAWSTCD